MKKKRKRQGRAPKSRPSKAKKVTQGAAATPETPDLNRHWTAHEVQQAAALMEAYPDEADMMRVTIEMLGEHLAKGCDPCWSTANSLAGRLSVVDPVTAAIQSLYHPVGWPVLSADHYHAVSTVGRGMGFLRLIAYEAQKMTSFPEPAETPLFVVSRILESLEEKMAGDSILHDATVLLTAMRGHHCFIAKNVKGIIPIMEELDKLIPKTGTQLDLTGLSDGTAVQVATLHARSAISALACPPRQDLGDRSSSSLSIIARQAMEKERRPSR